MDITRLIDRSNKMFELLEYTNYFGDYDEIVSLKISINNLLVEMNNESPNFLSVLLLSSPVLFDFAFNSKLDDNGLILRRNFERLKNYEEAKKWYKFIRNSLIHTNRYKYNNFLKSIYRIEYTDGASIYFELDKSKYYRFKEFKENRYFIENEQLNILDGIDSVFEIENNVRIKINSMYFNQFILDIINQFIRSLEHEVDNILNNEVNRWTNYYHAYVQMIDNVYWDNNFDLKLLKKLSKSLKRLKDFDLEEAYILCEFLIYMQSLNIELSEQQINDITTITTFDKYYQLDGRKFIMNEISSVKSYKREYINYDQVAWVLNEIYPLTAESDHSLQILEHTNYLIMYVQKYLTAKGVIANG